jgi:hypothetical protein
MLKLKRSPKAAPVILVKREQEGTTLRLRYLVG